MDWLINLFTSTNSVAHIALLYAIVIAVGVLLGKIKFFGISLGVTFVLFAGIVAGHIGLTGPIDILTFVQDFGLILFVFMIGMQVGPGFFESFRKGEEKGYFEMGSSTIVLMIKKDVIKIDEDILNNSNNGIETKVLIGERIGERNA